MDEGQSSRLATLVVHSYLVAGAANNGGEDSAGSIVTSEAGLAHTGAVINDKSLNITTVRHFVRRRV